MIICDDYKWYGKLLTGKLLVNINVINVYQGGLSSLAHFLDIDPRLALFLSESISIVMVKSAFGINLSLS